MSRARFALIKKDVINFEDIVSRFACLFSCLHPRAPGVTHFTRTFEHGAKKKTRVKTCHLLCVAPHSTMTVVVLVSPHQQQQHTSFKKKLIQSNSRARVPHAKNAKMSLCFSNAVSVWSVYSRKKNNKKNEV